MSSHYAWATAKSYKIVPETCPDIEKALKLAENEIKEKTSALRTALIDALTRVSELEEQVSNLEDQITSLQEIAESSR